MIRANIYSIDPVTAEFKQSVSDGLDTIGQYVGGITLARSHIVRLPTNAQGIVNHRSVGFSNFDPTTELHILAVPLGGEAGFEFGGLAVIGSGVSWLNTSRVVYAQQNRVIAAHEAAHSLGYVLPDSPQSVRADGRHCSDKACMMAATYRFDPEVQAVLDETDPIIRRMMKQGLRAIGLNADDLCNPCKADMRDTCEEQIDKIRFRRLTTGKII